MVKSSSPKLNNGLGTEDSLQVNADETPLILKDNVSSKIEFATASNGFSNFPLDMSKKTSCELDCPQRCKNHAWGFCP